MACRRHRIEDLQDSGDWCFSGPEVSPTAMWFLCPCGNGERCRIKVGAVPDEAQFIWGVQGDLDAPTIIPSIKRTTGCGYHGNLTKGVWAPS